MASFSLGGRTQPLSSAEIDEDVMWTSHSEASTVPLPSRSLPQPRPWSWFCPQEPLPEPWEFLFTSKLVAAKTP